MLSGQQNQLASGQQPAGQEVSSGPYCLFLAIFMSCGFLATKGQSAALAAQYMLSGQQNQLASGQQPAGQEVSLEYSGDVKNGRMEGKGEYIFASGTRYVGDFLDGKFHGQGILHMESGASIEGTWEHG